MGSVPESPEDCAAKAVSVSICVLVAEGPRRRLTPMVVQMRVAWMCCSGTVRLLVALGLHPVPCLKAGLWLFSNTR